MWPGAERERKQHDYCLLNKEMVEARKAWDEPWDLIPHTHSTSAITHGPFCLATAFLHHVFYLLPYCRHLEWKDGLYFTFLSPKVLDQHSITFAEFQWRRQQKTSAICEDSDVPKLKPVLESLTKMLPEITSCRNISKVCSQQLRQVATLFCLRLPGSSGSSEASHLGQDCRAGACFASPPGQLWLENSLYRLSSDWTQKTFLGKHTTCCKASHAAN